MILYSHCLIKESHEQIINLNSWKEENRRMITGGVNNPCRIQTWVKERLILEAPSIESQSKRGLWAIWAVPLFPAIVCIRQLTGVMSFPTVNSVSLDPEARKVEHYYLSSTQVDRDLVREGNKEILVEETKTVMVGLTLPLYTLTGSRTFIFNQKLKISHAWRWARQTFKLLTFKQNTCQRKSDLLTFIQEN